MTKKCIEICIISARGLRALSSPWKPQWFAVGWITRNNKYRTKVDKTGSASPTWNTKFSVPVDDSNFDLRGSSLAVEVYRRGAILNREKLQGAASVTLKDFFAKYGNGEAASLQLRKRKSSDVQGFVDVSVRVVEENDGAYSHSGFGEGFQHSDSKSDIPLPIQDDHTFNSSDHPYTYSAPNPKSSPNQSASTGDGYCQPPTPPPPPPPSHTGFLPTLFPETSLGMRSSDFGTGLGAGALAAGAVIFGDDFLSGPSFL